MSAPKQSKSRRPFSWHRLNNALHRDMGYLAVGLTLVYAISGLAVNHAHQWNASYSTTVVTQRIAADLDGPAPEAAARLLEELGLDGEWIAFHQDSGRTLYVGFKDRILSIRTDIETGDAILESQRPRWLLRELNQLHLNEPRGLWTWIADAYTLLLIGLAMTGIFVLRGRKGFGGRGKWLVAAGLAIPVLGYAVWRTGWL